MDVKDIAIATAVRTGARGKTSARKHYPSTPVLARMAIAIPPEDKLLDQGNCSLKFCFPSFNTILLQRFASASGTEVLL
jgi:hypothetical protein